MHESLARNPSVDFFNLINQEISAFYVLTGMRGVRKAVAVAQALSLYAHTKQILTWRYRFSH